MRSLFRYLLRNYAFVLFVLLEILALVMVFSNNRYQKTQYLNSANRVAGSVFNSFNSVVRYFELGKVNQQLAQENARLKSQVLNLSSQLEMADSLQMPALTADSAFRMIPARVINNSVNRPFNYITINKGRKDGIRPDMGIVSPDGVVGVVINVSDMYSLGLSVLNRRWSLSAKLKNTGYFGSLIWQGGSYRSANLSEIPFHVNLQNGDTVVTSGYSSVFPEGMMIGTIESFDKAAGENYYNIKVQLSTDFKSLHYVDVVENLNGQELNQLEKSIGDDAAFN